MLTELGVTYAAIFGLGIAVVLMAVGIGHVIGAYLSFLDNLSE